MTKSRYSTQSTYPSSTQKSNNENIANKQFNKLLTEWFFLLLIVSIAIFYYSESSFQRYSYILYDNLSKVMPAQHQDDNDVAIITIDEHSMDSLGHWPWPRVYHSKLIHTLQAAKPNVLAFNMFFTEKDHTDLALKKEISSSIFPIVLPVLPDLKNIITTEFNSKTDNTLLSTAHINADLDGVIRRITLINKKHNTLLPQLSLKAYWGAEYNDFHSTRLFNEYLINYINKNPSKFKQISYIDILNGNYLKEDLFGKIVLVGITAAGLGDRFLTPTAAYQSTTIIHAHIISNIINDTFIIELSTLIKASIYSLFIALYCIVILFFKKIHVSLVMCIFSFLAISLTVILLFFNIWWSPLSCMTVFVLSWLIWYWRRSSAVIAWLRYLINNTQSYQNNSISVDAIPTKKPSTEDVFQFELNALEKMLNSARALQTRKDNIRMHLSHDLRTPQVSMMDLINTQKDARTAISTHLFNIQMEKLINKSLSLLDDLIVLSKRDSVFLKLEPILLATVVQDSIDCLWSQLNSHNVTVHFSTEEYEFGEILGDAKLLSRAFTNIIENTIRHAGDGSTITIKIHRDTSGIILKITDTRPLLKDNNTPIQSSTSRACNFMTPSYGIGLELVKSAVDLHHATLTHHSSDTAGTVCVFVFPIPDSSDD